MIKQVDDRIEKFDVVIFTNAIKNDATNRVGYGGMAFINIDGVSTRTSCSGTFIKDKQQKVLIYAEMLAIQKFFNNETIRNAKTIKIIPSLEATRRNLTDLDYGGVAIYKILDDIKSKSKKMIIVVDHLEERKGMAFTEKMARRECDRLKYSGNYSPQTHVSLSSELRSMINDYYSIDKEYRTIDRLYYIALFSDEVSKLTPPDSLLRAGKRQVAREDYEEVVRWYYAGLGLKTASKIVDILHRHSQEELTEMVKESFRDFSKKKCDYANKQFFIPEKDLEGITETFVEKMVSSRDFGILTAKEVWAGIRDNYLRARTPDFVRNLNDILDEHHIGLDGLLRYLSMSDETYKLLTEGKFFPTRQELKKMAKYLEVKVKDFYREDIRKAV